MMHKRVSVDIAAQGGSSPSSELSWSSTAKKKVNQWSFTWTSRMHSTQSTIEQYLLS
jgi:hypothetical protein